MLRVAASLAALASAPAAWSGSHAVGIGAIVVAPSQCRFGESVSAAPSREAPNAATDAKATAAYRCAGASASTVSWSVSPDGARNGSSHLADATVTLAGTGASADVLGKVVGNYADTLVLTITP
jgi:hypothetical protein